MAIVIRETAAVRAKGPCRDGCGHRACADARVAFGKPCAVCNRPLGLDAAILCDDWGFDAHLACVQGRRS